MTPFIVGLGGTTRADSSTERALRTSLEACRSSGAEVELFGADALALPMYDPSVPERTDEAKQLVAALRRCDGVVVASPGYHGTISGLVKNALDYVEDLREDDRPYFDGLAVGTIACAYGWPATINTLVALRSVVHALRGWPTPMGAAVNSSDGVFDEVGVVVDERCRFQLELVGQQVVDFARSAM